jgi:hypothetical protein
MLFPRNPAKGGTSGPQACFLAGKRIAKVKVDKKGLFLDKGKRGSLCFARTFQGPLGGRKEDFPFQSGMGE